ncbi:MAG: hypothetical protein WCD30_05355, partial [Pseudolabrys sp.]
LRLSDIAQIQRGFADPPQPLFRVNGQPAIGLAIAMREGGDILAYGIIYGFTADGFTHRELRGVLLASTVACQTL